MTSKRNDLPLSQGFNGGDQARWREAIDRVLKGGDFNKRLTSKTADNITLQPLYMQAGNRSAVPNVRSGQPWHLAQRVDHPQPDAANKLALEDLENGADSLVLVSSNCFTARGFGINLETEADLDRALKSVDLGMIKLRIEAGTDGQKFATAVAALADTRGLAPADLSIDFGLAPLAQLMSDGKRSMGWKETATKFSDTIQQLKNRGFQGPFISCDTRPISEAGGSEAQELAVAIASAVEYLRALTTNGFELSDAAATVSFAVAIDAGQFEGIAKLRALRKLWARIQSASDIGQTPVSIHAESAWRMATKRDPGVNMLRATMATFTACIGGADSISILPHTLALGLPDAFARRVARNTQTVLQEESNLWRVTDPSAGAGATEALTDELCSTAWSLFQEIEREGGLVACLSSGSLQKRIADVANKREKRLATRQQPITGTSEFPQLTEATSGLLDITPQHPAAPNSGSTGMNIVPLPSRRLAEPYEALRDAADKATEKAGKRPAVFLANLGSVAEHNARATWMTNLMAAGGLDVVTNEGFTNSADVGAAFQASGLTIACICSTDANYANLGEATASILKTVGASHVVLAGKPTDELKSAGVDTFLHVGVDVLAQLGDLHTRLDI